MPTISEEQLSKWTAPAFDNEDARRGYTEELIREAIAADEFLASLSIDVYAKGSYKNNTNVRLDSDVDIAVEYTGIVFFGYWQSATKENVWAERGIRPYSGRCAMPTAPSTLTASRTRSEAPWRRPLALPR